MSQKKIGATYGMSDIRGGKCQQVGKGAQDGVALSPDDCRYDLQAQLPYGVYPNYDQEPSHHGYHHQHHWCLCDSDIMSLIDNFVILNATVTKYKGAQKHENCSQKMCSKGCPTTTQVVAGKDGYEGSWELIESTC